ncbi:P-loop containing nucleoside triphosphate hydrolase protein [Fusarium flagelliforme]|uniref:P-loop containing nucleoside triphosphate hydrolase protein n=1 Tax=Fusarium flagelliforme TaxID=2675880 RepID=UPI001E8D1C7C|nr:P-loop containing nucleoside triphosphate hydrolase protein [Fusarium flagelliforme]KAH7179551.1 P-loop containing nucleoside triphosphate hydrolase protein [Fusarium flagelliforme]
MSEAIKGEDTLKEPTAGIALQDEDNTRTSQDRKGDNSSKDYVSEHTDSDSVSSENRASSYEFNDKQFVLYLRGLHHRIVDKLRAPPIGDIPNLRPGITLQEHQKHAVGKAEWAMKSEFKGMILGDPPGLGKTLSALSMIARASHIRGGPSIIVAPSSCCQQWMGEIKKFFNDDSMPTLCLVDEKTPEHQLFRYKIIVTSYNQVSAEYERLGLFSRAVQDCIEGRLAYYDLPKRPTVTLLSEDFFHNPITMPLGPLLILDDVNNLGQLTHPAYQAIYKLRKRLDTCIMMSGTPLTDNWMDAHFQLSLLGGHNIPFPRKTDVDIAFMGLQGEREHRESPFPPLVKMCRIIQMMDAITVRRPSTIVTQDLPPLVFKEWRYRSTSDHTAISNMFLARFKQASELHEFDTYRTWFPRAKYFAYHPMLNQLHDIEDRIWLSSMVHSETTGEVFLEDQEEQRLAQWHREIIQGRNWESERTVRLIEIVNFHLNVRPDDAMVIMDESIYFLDIIEVAIRKSFPNNDRGAMPVFRYDGRVSPDEREAVLERFNTATRVRLLLASRITGGQGLNLQSANVLIRCGPWESVFWEQQAEGRIYRFGQNKPTFVFELYDECCHLDTYLRETRYKSSRVTSQILDAITHEDDRDEPTKRKIR